MKIDSRSVVVFDSLVGKDPNDEQDDDDDDDEVTWIRFI